ncbi:DUF5808 domain-containing protein [Actinotalea sp. K2]|uniref:DUF5808 domain-containing protein n=1 Tax=Actinotalea sp. K2 TaxID=2939438 RepID=UPI002017948F|nr:DUF5808 domain-containing protein [Actinotalea sp. K2]MCL3862502.1 hypothetical protein [Actinotalea sp. K2]
MGTAHPSAGRRGPSPLQLAFAALAVAAVVKELRLPSDQRTWHGVVIGFVPYEFRVPTLPRVKARVWNPEGPLLSPHVFGVGWTLNIGKVVALVRRSGEARQHPAGA